MFIRVISFSFVMAQSFYFVLFRGKDALSCIGHRGGFSSFSCDPPQRFTHHFSIGAMNGGGWIHQKSTADGKAVLFR